MRPAWLPVGLVLLLLLGGCGESPGQGGGVRSEGEVLEALHADFADAATTDVRVWSEDARRVAEVLWPIVPGRPPAPEAQVHLDLALVAGEVARWLGASESARADRTQSNPVDVEIHDAFVEAVARDPARYRAWIAGPGTALLAKLRAERRSRFFGNR